MFFLIPDVSINAFNSEITITDAFHELIKIVLKSVNLILKILYSVFSATVCSIHQSFLLEVGGTEPLAVSYLRNSLIIVKCVLSIPCIYNDGETTKGVYLACR